MRRILVILATVCIFWIITGCGSNRQYYARVKKEFPTFYIGKFSWDAMIFKDTILYRQSFSDGGGMLSDIFPIGNWKFINDSTIECYNLKPGKRSAPTFKIYHLDRIDSLTQVLIPEKSLTYYRDSLQAKFHAWMLTPYKVIEEDRPLIKSDSVRAYKILLTMHRKILIDRFERKFNDLGIYNGNGF